MARRRRLVDSPAGGAMIGACATALESRSLAKSRVFPRSIFAILSAERPPARSQTRVRCARTPNNWPETSAAFRRRPRGLHSLQRNAVPPAPPPARVRRRARAPAAAALARITKKGPDPVLPAPGFSRLCDLSLRAGRGPDRAVFQKKVRVEVQPGAPRVRKSCGIVHFRRERQAFTYV